mgnify:CR=1 FL=1
MLKLLKFLKPLKYFAALTVFLSLANNALQLLLPTLMADLVNIGISNGDRDFIFQKGLWMIAISAVSTFAAVGTSYCSSRTATGFGRTVRGAVFKKVESLSQCDIDKIGTPSLITRNTNDINKIQEMLIAILRTVIAAPVLMVGGVFMAFRMNRKLSMVLFIVIPVISLIAFLIARRVIPMFRLMQLKTDSLNKILREKLTGIRVIRAFNRSQYEDNRFKRSNEELTQLAFRIARIFAGLMPLVVLLLFGLLVLIVYIISGQLNALDPGIPLQNLEIKNTVGNLQAFIVYLTMIIYAVSLAAEMLIMLPRASISARRINEVLDIETKIKEPLSPARTVKGEGRVLEFTGVSFSYPGAGQPALTGIDFSAKSGETTAIIGGTGSGKSTLVSLIPRFYDVTEGSVCIDGVDIRTMRTGDLHDKIGFIPQKTFLFSGTVADNLSFGLQGASEERMWEALETAQAAEFVRELPYGLYDMISQNGKNLSGGQQQRLAIARALIRPAAFYIFDDSFSALDFKTDLTLRKGLKKELKDAAVIIVAQRIGTIMDADRILVLDEGRIVGDGKHRELMENCAVYREIAVSQLSGEELA